jgi:hypothetical protein
MKVSTKSAKGVDILFFQRFLPFDVFPVDLLSHSTFCPSTFFTVGFFLLYLDILSVNPIFSFEPYSPPFPPIGRHLSWGELFIGENFFSPLTCPIPGDPSHRKRKFRLTKCTRTARIKRVPKESCMLSVHFVSWVLQAEGTEFKVYTLGKVCFF